MNKIKLLFSIFLVSLCLASCKEKNDDNLKETEISTESSTKKGNIQHITDLEIVQDASLFGEVKKPQEWNFETDVNPNAMPVKGVAESENITYLNCSNILVAFSKENGSAKILCEKPDCEHISINSDACEADLRTLGLDANGLQYYNGALYYLVKQGGIALYRVSSDGKTKMQSALVSDSSSGTLQSFPWLIHREYIYFWNEGKGICKVSMINPEQKELIVKECKEANSCQDLKAYGSYLYFTLSGESENIFARYNIESEQIEYFPKIKGLIERFFVKENKIYYKTYEDTKIYQYDISSESIEVFFEMENGNYSFYADADYIYIPKVISEEKRNLCDVSANVYTWNKEFVGTIPHEKNIYKEAGKRFHNETIYMIGSDSERIYYNKYLVEGDNIPNHPAQEEKILGYIKKSEISENGTDITTALENAPFDNILGPQIE